MLRIRYYLVVARFMPFKKDLIFVGYKTIISAIKKRYKAIGQQYKRVVLVGLAGISNAARLEESY
ncbi:hypothetical protein N7527_009028 [Penicillium freii]|nr:hypothetical protein N7527_009028 [Penicillium freii]